MLLAVSVLLLGGLTTIMPPAAQAQVLVAQSTGNVVQSSYQKQQVNKLLEQGRKLVDIGDVSGAIALYGEAVSLEPKNPRIFSGIGYLQAYQGNYSAAAVAYRQAIALEPNNADFHYALAYSLGKLGENASAAQAYRRTIELEPNNLNAFLGLGVVLFRQ